MGPIYPFHKYDMSQPHFGAKCEKANHTPKSGKIEPFRTLECSELDSKANNTLHWGVLGVIEKVLKRRYQKWPCIGHLDICSPSYGQKKGRFDFRPLKVGNWPLFDIRFECATWHWKDINERYNFGSGLVAIGFCNWELLVPKIPRLQPGQFRDSISEVPRKCAIW
jgi:hypothetical protein